MSVLSLLSTTEIAVAKVLPEYRAIHEAADRMVPAIRRAFLQAVVRMQGRLPLTSLADALARGDLNFLDREGFWAQFADDLRPGVRQAVEQIVTRAGGAALQRMPESVQSAMQFDLTNPRAITAVDTQVERIVRDLVNVNAESVTAVIRDGFQHGIAPRDMARRIRDNIGLHPQYANAVERYRRVLTERGLAPLRVNSLTTQYADRLRNLRALTIARTETIRAANAGQQAVWQESARDGLLESSAKRIWIVTPDDRLCPRCEDAETANENGVGLDEPFATDEGALMTPPLHANCRCAVALMTED